MSLSNKITSAVTDIIATKWDKRHGVVVPDTESIKLSGGAVELDATFLYADLANSSRLAKELDRRVAAKILKSFLATSTQLIRNLDGTAISFDGDRVLGVFVGDCKNSNASKCGLQINWAVSKIIRVKFEQEYPTVGNLNFKISHGVGIDSGTVLIVRAGARGENDMISIGRAPSLAAKLSEVRKQNSCTYLTESVYNRLNDSSKYGGDPTQNMWRYSYMNFLGSRLKIYQSSWTWQP